MNKMADFLAIIFFGGCLAFVIYDSLKLWGVSMKDKVECGQQAAIWAIVIIWSCLLMMFMEARTI